MKKGTKRKADAATTIEPSATTTTPEETQQQHNEESTRVGRPTKRSKASKPKVESDIWKQIPPIGIEWEHHHLLYEYKWNFSNLEDAFEEGGVLHEKKVYLFCSTEPQVLGGELKVIMIPVVVAVVSPFPPSDKVGIKSVQRATERIVDMKDMKMDWVPYIPSEKRGTSVARYDSQIYILTCVQRRAGLKQLDEDRVKDFEYCLPYFYHPFEEDVIEQSTEVSIIFPQDPSPVVYEYDWQFDKPEEVADTLIKEEVLFEDNKNKFMEFVKKKVEKGAKANREAKKKRKLARESMSKDKKDAFEQMKFYKFYPVATPDTPNVSEAKEPFINRYYRKAHQVF